MASLVAGYEMTVEFWQTGSLS